MPAGDMRKCKGTLTAPNSNPAPISAWIRRRRNLARLREGTWSVNEEEKTFVKKHQLALIPNLDTQERKAAVILSGDDLKLVYTLADGGVRTEYVYRRAK
jgi:hypothetical protein